MTVLSEFPAPISISYMQVATSDKECGPVELQPGYFLSNEPGYYKKGDFGVRLENILEVVEASKPVTFERNCLLTAY